MVMTYPATNALDRWCIVLVDEHIEVIGVRRNRSTKTSCAVMCKPRKRESDRALLRRIPYLEPMDQYDQD